MSGVVSTQGTKISKANPPAIKMEELQCNGQVKEKESHSTWKAKPHRSLTE